MGSFCVAPTTCSFSDPKTDTELCRYNLESKDTKAETAVLMCVMRRKGVSGALHKQFEVTALGQTCGGRASHYAPIRAVRAFSRARPLYLSCLAVSLCLSVTGYHGQLEILSAPGARGVHGTTRRR